MPKWVLGLVWVCPGAVMGDSSESQASQFAFFTLFWEQASVYTQSHTHFSQLQCQSHWLSNQPRTLALMHQSPEEGHPGRSSSFLLPREDLQAFAIPLILCVASQECMSQPSLLFPSYWFCVEHFYSLSYIGVFLPVSSLLLGKIIPHIDVFLIFSWGKVSSAFFYSTILISEAVFLLSNSLVSKSLWLFLFF